MTERVIDLFAGPGGWDVGAAWLEPAVEPVGVEWDDNCCLTREAAGLTTIQGDVGELDPVITYERAYGMEGERHLDGLIASPPCQAYSSAGKREGRHDIEHVLAAHNDLLQLRDTRAEHAAKCVDQRSILVVEPLRWALALQPTWCAFEQVPAVMPYWREVAAALTSRGWYCWTGILSAERYGVPQTRERAILMAHRERAVYPPAPTHQRYVKGEAPVASDDLFGESLEPWVSMAEALGWGLARRPSTTVVTKRDGGGSTSVVDGGSGAREVYHEARAAGDEEWIINTRGERDTPGGNEFPASRPSWALTEKTRSWWRYRTSTMPNATERALHEPAPTVAYGHDAASAGWVITHMDPRQSPAAQARPRPVDEPAATLLAEGMARGKDVWTTERPATTIAGDPRVHPPGHKINQADIEAGRDHYDGRAGKRAIRVQVEEALVLQSFPADYPLRGPKSSQFRQVGDAVPPLLAYHVLGALR